MKPEDIIRKVVMAEMLTLYQPPRHVQTEEAAAIYQTALIESLAGFDPTEAEMEAVWRRFKAEWKRTTWPTPGDLCQALAAHREKQTARTPHEAITSNATYQPDFRPLTAAEQADFDRCVADLRANPDRYFASEALLRMAEVFEKRDR